MKGAGGQGRRIVPAPRDQDVLVKAARLYYEEDRSQADIARVLGLSRSNVSRMLASARERGIVEIKINDPSGRDLALERRLEDHYGLADCRVADAAGPDRAMTRTGDLGARWILEHVQPGQRIGLSWGTTLQALVAQVPAGSGAADLQVVPLVGGLSSVDTAITGDELVRDLAGRLGARLQRLHAPAVLASAAGRDVLLDEPTIHDALEAARHADLAVVGIGTTGRGSSAAIVEIPVLDEAERAAFAAARPVGDMCARFFDAAGAPVGGAVDDRIIAVTLAELARIPTVVGVAAGREKVPGVSGALRTGAVDVLVCDRALALALLP